MGGGGPKQPVWDVPTRLFHWTLVALIAFSWWSAEEHHTDWHIWSGIAVLTLLTFLATRYSSVGGMMAGLSAPASALLFGRIDLAILLAGLALLVVWKHRSNIGRLIRGEEPKVGRSRAS